MTSILHRVLLPCVVVMVFTLMLTPLLRQAMLIGTVLVVLVMLRSRIMMKEEEEQQQHMIIAVAARDMANIDAIVSTNKVLTVGEALMRWMADHKRRSSSNHHHKNSTSVLVCWKTPWKNISSALRTMIFADDEWLLFTTKHAVATTTTTPHKFMAIITPDMLQCHTCLSALATQHYKMILDATSLTEIIREYTTQIENGKAGQEWWKEQLMAAKTPLHSDEGDQFNPTAACQAGLTACITAIATHVFEHIQSTSSNEEIAALVLDSQGCFHAAAGDAVQAKKFYEMAMVRYTALFPDRESPAIAACLNNLATAYAALGQYDVAIADHNEALAIRRRVCGDSGQLDVAQSLNNLGVVLRKTKQFDEARKAHVEALNIRETILGYESIDTAGSLHNLAICLKAIGKMDEASVAGVNAMRICERLLDPNHPLAKATRKAWGGDKKD